jgi:hypothetical protein
VNKDASIAEMEQLASELLFAGLSPDDKLMQDIQDSMMNNYFGSALDFRIRGMDRGFKLSEVHQKVLMEHSRLDEGFTAITSKLLPNCQFCARETEGNFLKKLRDDFINKVMEGSYK